jgi:predicted DCC family thiol-disulfide oxidoreductase YuxK
MVFDGDCGFCKFWIERWSRATGGRIDYKPYQEVALQYPEVPLSVFESAVQLIETDGTVRSGADAVFRAMSLSGAQNWLLLLLRQIPAFDRCAAGAYVFVARHRAVFSLLTRLFWGRRPEPPTYFFAHGLFLRMLALIYFIAFTSLAVQITGLAGRRGIVPAAEFLQAVHAQVGGERFWLLPTLCWINASDGFLVSLCVAGALISCLALAGFLQAVCLLLLWAAYLSLVNIGGPFLSFQWDSLLLETGFFAIFLAPWRAWSWRNIAVRASPVARWLLLWLLFRLMFESGVVKLSSGDSSWRDLTALTCHYETQPLPLWTSWYLNQAPFWFQKFSVLGVFAIEFGGALLIVAPRNLRRAGTIALIVLQLLIATTGRAASTASRLADVVRRPWDLAGQRLVHPVSCASPRGFARCAWTAGLQSFPRCAAALRACRVVRLQIYTPR